MTEIDIAFGDGGIEPWIGLIGGLVGAILGSAVSGGISYRLQKREHDRADTLRQADLQLRQRSVAHRLIDKLLAIQTDLEMVRKHYESQENRDREAQVDRERWTFHVPLFVGVDNIHFDSEEAALLLDLGLHEVFNDVSSLPRVHNHHLEIIRVYTVKREQMRAQLPPGEMNGNTGAYFATRAVEAATGPLRTEMNAILNFAVGTIGKDAADAAQGLRSAHLALTEKLGLQFKLS